MKEILDIINKNKTFALFCHIGPDADALGSVNALRLTLKKMNKKAYAFCDGKIPNNIAFLKIPLEEKASKIAKFAVILGEDELENNQVTIKNLDTAEQQTINRKNVTELLK